MVVICGLISTRALSPLTFRVMLFGPFAALDFLHDGQIGVAAALQPRRSEKKQAQ